MKTPKVSIKIDQIKASPLIVGWARRFNAGKPSTEREKAALVEAWPNLDEETKAALGGDSVLDWASNKPISVLALPYGGPNAGKDDHGQYFSPNTDFGSPAPPKIYYVHGSQNGFSAETIAEPVSDYYFKADGGWIDILLDYDNPRYNQLIEARDTGNLFASSGAIPASTVYGEDGHIDSWTPAEISFVDLRDGYKPVNRYAVTKAELDPNVLFEDYYNDPVIEKDCMNESMWEKIRQFASELFAKEKCEACDEADELKAVAESMKLEPAKCEKCPEAVKWVGLALKAGKIPPDEAIQLLDQYKVNADGWEEKAEEVNKRTVVPNTVTKAEVFIAGGQQTNVQDSVDPDYMNRMRKAAGIKV